MNAERRGGRMRVLRIFLGIFLVILCLAGCASTTTRTHGLGDDWQAYRQEIMQQRDEGKLSPVEAEALIEKKFQEL
jgi:hypothetical protein